MGQLDEADALRRDGEKLARRAVVEPGGRAEGRLDGREAAVLVGEPPPLEPALAENREAAALRPVRRLRVGLPVRVGREEAATPLRVLDGVEPDRVLRRLLPLRVEPDALAPRRRPEEAALFPPHGGLQLGTAPAKAERAGGLGRRLVDELDGDAQFRREGRDAELAPDDEARLRERGLAREERAAAEVGRVRPRREGGEERGARKRGKAGDAARGRPASGGGSGAVFLGGRGRHMHPGLLSVWRWTADGTPQMGCTPTNGRQFIKCNRRLSSRPRQSPATAPSQIFDRPMSKRLAVRRDCAGRGMTEAGR